MGVVLHILQHCCSSVQSRQLYFHLTLPGSMCWPVTANLNQRILCSEVSVGLQAADLL